MKLFLYLLLLLFVSLIATIIAVVQVAGERDRALAKLSAISLKLDSVQHQLEMHRQVFTAAKTIIQNQREEIIACDQALSVCDCER